MWLQWAEWGWGGGGTPSPDGGDSVFPSGPQSPVAAQSFQQEMSSSSRLSQGRRVWAPLPLGPSGLAWDLSATLGTGGRLGRLGCWVWHGATSWSAGVLMLHTPARKVLMTFRTIDFPEF